MNKELRRKGLSWAVPGLIIQAAGAFCSAAMDKPLWAQLLVLLGAIMAVVGCSHYAKAKGQDPRLGALGALSVIGLLALSWLEDKTTRGLGDADNGTAAADPSARDQQWTCPRCSCENPNTTYVCRKCSYRVA